MYSQRHALLDKKYQNDLSIIGVPVSYKKGQLIFSPGDCTENIYLIDSGYVRIYDISRDGTRVTLAIRYPGEIIGLVEPMFQNTIKYYVEAFRDVRLIKTNRQKILQKINDNPDFALSLVEMMGVRLREAQEIACAKSVTPANVRLAMLLKELSYKSGILFGDKIQLKLRLTQEEMASVIGTCRQTISIILGQFKRQQAVYNKDGKTYINPALLSEVIESH